MMTRCLLAIVMAAAILLAGCAAAPPQVPEQLRATHGFVRVTILSRDKQFLFELENERGDRFSLKRQEDVGTSSFGLWLPAGQYHIPDMKQVDGKPYPLMSVEASRILDLGALITLDAGSYQVLDLVMPHADAEPDLQATIKQLRPHLASTEPLRWKQEVAPAPAGLSNNPRAATMNSGFIVALLVAASDEARRPPMKELLRKAKTAAEVYQIAVASSQPWALEPAVATNGDLYYGADLGQLRVRHPDGRWDHLDTGSLGRILTVSAFGPRVLVGSLQGDLRASEDDGKTWRVVTRFDGDAVVDIDRVGARWFVLTTKDLPWVGSHVIRWRLWTLDEQALDKPTLVRETIPKNPMSVMDDNRVRGVVTADGSAYYINGFEGVWKVDPATMAVTPVPVPMSRVSRFDIAGDQRTLTAFESWRMFSKLSVSTDGGATWKARPAPPNAVDVHTDASGTMQAAGWDTGLETSRMDLHVLAAGSDKWKPGPEVPEDCLRLLKDASGAPATCVTKLDRLLTYRAGRWVEEY